MKRFIFSFLLMSLFCLSNVCFAKSWSNSELEKLIECFGYSHVDIPNEVVTRINSVGYFSITKYGSDKENSEYANDKFLISISSSNTKFKNLLQNYDYLDLENLRGYTYLFDCSNNTYEYSVHNTIPHCFYLSNNNVSRDVFLTDSYQQLIFNDYVLYSTNTFQSTNGNIIFMPYGGEIVSSSTDVVYKGKIIYIPTTKSVNITYTSGFSSEISYDLFLEVYRLDNEYEKGIIEYPVDTINLGIVNNTITSKKIDIDNTLKSSFYVYRLCLGVNNFEETGINKVFLSTNWLLPNDNTIRRFPTFSRSHFIEFLSLVDYDYLYDYDNEYDPDKPILNPSGDISSGDNNDFSEIKTGIGGILQNIIDLPKKLIDGLLEGIKSLFIPSEDFFENYWNDLNLFLTDKLGFLWECVMFVPNLVNNVTEVLKGVTQNTSFVVPEISVPTFMGDGSEVVILESFEFNPYTYWGQNQTFTNLYVLYLNLIDFLVFCALFSYCLSILAKILGFVEEPEPEHETIGFKTD